MVFTYTTVGCFECASHSLVEWIKSGCEVHIVGQKFYIPKDQNIHALFALNGIELVNDEVTRLRFIKNCRGYYISDNLKSSLPSYLKRMRRFLAEEGKHLVLKNDVHGDAYQFALTVVPLKDADE